MCVLHNPHINSYTKLFIFFVILSMADQGLIDGSENLWGDDDQSWSFPNLEEENGRKNDDALKIKLNEGGDDVDEVVKVEVPQLPGGKGKKRNASGGGKKKGGGGGGGDKDKVGGESDHELHIWTERERRKKMRNMFASLHSLLPHLPPKADKSTIVDEAVQQIKKLEKALEKLQNKKLERLHGMNYSASSSIMTTQQKLALTTREAFLADQQQQGYNVNTMNPQFTGSEYPPAFKTWTSPNVVLNISGRDAHISLCCPKKACLFTGICFVMDKYKLEIISAQVSSDRSRSIYMIHVQLANGACEQFPVGFPVEEIYKQAGAELMLWVNS